MTFQHHDARISMLSLLRPDEMQATVLARMDVICRCRAGETLSLLVHCVKADFSKGVSISEILPNPETWSHCYSHYAYSKSSVEDGSVEVVGLVKEARERGSW